MSPSPHSDRPSSRWLALAAACAVLAAPASADAQVAGSVPVQQFQPTQSQTGGYLQLWQAKTPGHLRPAFGVWGDYAFRPLELQNYTTDTQVDLIRHHLEVDVTAALGLGKRFEVGLAFPVTPFITQGEPGFAVPPDIAGFGLGDLRLAGSWHFLGDGTGFNLAGVALVSLPTGDEARNLGNLGLTYEPRLVADLGIGDALGVAANVGFLVRPDTQTLSYNGRDLITVGHELTYGLGGRFTLGGPDLDLLAEVSGRVAIGEGLDGSGIPMEAVGAVRKRLGGGAHAVTLGGGAGLVGGYGSPNARVFLGYAFAPLAKVDTDGDGIYDEDDSCPNDPEDLDNHQDEDGCPDPDNDADGILDATDKCPNKAEDKDGFQDEDGCPDPDNDGDGVLDPADQCPDQLEDRDGYKDDDGCPDPDNDSDGILDVDDKCPSEKETINGVDDEDGCPDEGKSDVQVTDTHIEILQRVFFETGSDVIKKESYKLLNQVALTLKANMQLTLVQVEGHTDDVGDDASNMDLSQRRANSVMRYLVDKGVSESRLHAVGYGETRPLAKGKSSKARARNRRVEFHILEIDGQPALDEHGQPVDKGTAVPMEEAPLPEGKAAVKEGAQVPADATPMDLAPAGATLSGKTGSFKVISFFAEGSAELDARSQGLCETYGLWMKTNPKVNIRLMAFNDDTGDAAADVALSQQRGEALKGCLVAQGVEARRVQIQALGSKWPTQPNDSAAHRAENRRVRMLPVTGSGNEIKKLPVELRVAEPSFQ